MLRCLETSTTVSVFSKSRLFSKEDDHTHSFTKWYNHFVPKILLLISMHSILLSRPMSDPVDFARKWLHGPVSTYEAISFFLLGGCLALFFNGIILVVYFQCKYLPRRILRSRRPRETTIPHPYYLST